MSHTHFQQLSSPVAREVASSEVSATAEAEFAPRVAQVNSYVRLYDRKEKEK